MTDNKRIRLGSFLHYMGPSFFPPYSQNCRFTYSVYRTHLTRAGNAFEFLDGSNIRICKSGLRQVFSSTYKRRVPSHIMFRSSGHSAFGKSVLNVVRWCSYKQVIWSYTGSVVTTMANNHSWRDRSIMYLVRKSMCGLCPSSPGRVPTWEVPVARTGKRLIPTPTPKGDIRFNYVLPKSNFRMGSVVRSVTSIRTILSPSFSYFRRVRLKFHFAMKAFGCHCLPRFSLTCKWMSVEVV